MADDRANGPGPGGRSVSEGDLFAEMADYLDHLRLRGRAATARTCGQALEQFAGWLRRRGLDPLRAAEADLQDYLAWLAGEYRSPNGRPLARSTLGCRIAYIKGWYKWLEGRGRLVADPSRRLKVHVPRSRVVVKERLTLQEAAALLQTQAAIVHERPEGGHQQAVALRNLAVLCVALASGRRIGGLVALRVAHVDLERRELRVEREKGRAGRVLPIAGWAVDVLRLYLDQARPLLCRDDEAPWRFLDRDGAGPITRDALGWMLETLLARVVADNPDLEELSRKRITWHSLRVSFASLLFANGCDIRSVNELLLHRCLSTTARYTPVPVEDLRRVFRAAHPRP